MHKGYLVCLYFPCGMWLHYVCVAFFFWMCFFSFSDGEVPHSLQLAPVDAYLVLAWPRHSCE